MLQWSEGFLGKVSDVCVRIFSELLGYRLYLAEEFLGEIPDNKLTNPSHSLLFRLQLLIGQTKGIKTRVELSEGIWFVPTRSNKLSHLFYNMLYPILKTIKIGTKCTQVIRPIQALRRPGAPCQSRLRLWLSLAISKNSSSRGVNKDDEGGVLATIIWKAVLATTFFK